MLGPIDTIQKQKACLINLIFHFIYSPSSLSWLVKNDTQHDEVPGIDDFFQYVLWGQLEETQTEHAAISLLNTVVKHTHNVLLIIITSPGVELLQSTQSGEYVWQVNGFVVA